MREPTADMQLEAIRGLLDEDLDDCQSAELVTLVEELDNWLTGGGPLPQEWCRIRRMLAGGSIKPEGTGQEGAGE